VAPRRRQAPDRSCRASRDRNSRCAVSRSTQAAPTNFDQARCHPSARRACYHLRVARRRETFSPKICRRGWRLQARRARADKNLTGNGKSRRNLSQVGYGGFLTCTTLIDLGERHVSFGPPRLSASR
jgi:hypothetical protein